MNCDPIFKSFQTKDKNKDIKFLKGCFDFSSLVKKYELFSNVNEKFLASLKLKHPKVFGLMT